MKKMISAFLLFLACHLIHGQNTTANSKDLADRIVAARNFSASIAPDYSWNCRTEVTRDGKVMDILLDLARYGPDGLVQYVVLNEKGAKLPAGFLIHQIAEDEKNKMVNFLHGLKTFLEKYSLPAELEIINFISKAKMEYADAGNTILLEGSDVIIAGDKLSWWIGKDNYRTEKIVVMTRFDGDQIDFTATFKFLNCGLNYMAYAEASISSKNMVLQLQNFDYTRNDTGPPK